MAVIDEVKQRTDIVEIISQYTALAKAGKTFRGLCPFHSEKHGSFFVYPEQQSWHCFGACATGGDVFSFIMKKQGIDFGEALRLLADRAGVIVPSRQAPDAHHDEKERLYQANEAAARYFHDLLLTSPAAQKARDYVAGRGIDTPTVAGFQLGYSLSSWEALKQHLTEKGFTENEMLEAGLVVQSDDKKTHDRFRNRLLFPIRDTKGRTTGFGARVLDDSLPKYVNSPQTTLFDKSGGLYGIDLASSAIRQQDLAVIVEGYMDVIIPHQYGFKNVVASMGTAITEKQINTLKKLSRNLALALDSDAAGEEAMLRCVGYENTLDAEIHVIILPEGKDPDEVIKQDPQKWQELVEKAVPVIDYTFNMVTGRLDLSRVKDKTAAADRLLPVIAQIKDVVRQAHYLQKLASLLKVSERELGLALKKSVAPIKRLSAVGGATQKSAARPISSLVSSPIEEYCLALLLQNPDLKARTENLPLEFFGNSENREIFVAWRQSPDVTSCKDQLDLVIQEHLITLLAKEIPGKTNTDEKYDSLVLRLREKFLKSLETKKEAALLAEAQSGGAAAELAKLKEQGIEESVRLLEVFNQKAGRRR